MSETTITTRRLTLRIPCKADAPQLLKLFNQADFIANIRDKNIRTQAQAVEEIDHVIHTHFIDNGFCLMSIDTTEVKCIGMCGLVKRPALAVPDIGFALLSEHQNKGYVTEASRAVLSYGFNELKLSSIAAIVNPDNMASIAVITKLGMPFIKGIQLDEGEPQVKYFELTREAYLAAY